MTDRTDKSEKTATEMTIVDIKPVGLTGQVNPVGLNLIIPPPSLPPTLEIKKALMREWKRKSGIQALICYESSIYYSFMNLFFGVPPIIMVSAIGVIESYNGLADQNKFFLAKIILSPMAALFKAIHLQCDYSNLSECFKKAYNKYSSIKRDMDIYESMNLSEDELLKKISEIKSKIESAKESTPTPPWIVYRKYDESKELSVAETLSEKMD